MKKEATAEDAGAPARVTPEAAQPVEITSAAAPSPPVVTGGALAARGATTSMAKPSAAPTAVPPPAPTAVPPPAPTAVPPPPLTASAAPSPAAGDCCCSYGGKPEHYRTTPDCRERKGLCVTKSRCAAKAR